VLLGIDKLLSDGERFLHGKQVGLLTNQAALTSEWRVTAEAICSLPYVHRVTLLSPEHGWTATEPDATAVSDSWEEYLRVPVHSLYGRRRKPDLRVLQEFDVVVVDLQDAGVRCYTYSTSLAHLLEAARMAEVPVVVCDRPNPLGSRVNGPIRNPVYQSFLGYLPIPLQHGLTLGELARWYANTSLQGDVELHVVSMPLWQRDSQWVGPWIPPSPGLPSHESVHLYPGMVLLEGTNVSEGRGTTLPFQVLGAPWIDGFDLATRMNRCQLPGLRFRPVSFTPEASKYTGEQCRGIQVHVLDGDEVDALEMGILLLGILHQAYPDSFSWLERGESPVSFLSELSRGKAGPTHGYFIDYLLGTDRLRLAIGDSAQLADLRAEWVADNKAFLQRVDSELLYAPTPLVGQLGKLARRTD